MSNSEIKKKFSNSNNVYFGHGIGRYNKHTIKSIFNNGLRCSHEQLAFTTITFGLGSQTLFNENEDLMNNWKHKDSKHIIIASLPLDLQLKGIMGTSLYGKEQAAFYNYISEEEAENLGISRGYYLRPEFVMGMYDADKKSFISNGNYYENLKEDRQKEILDEVKNKYIDILKNSEYTFTEYNEILKEFNVPNPLTAEEIKKLDKVPSNFKDSLKICRKRNQIGKLDVDEQRREIATRIEKSKQNSQKRGQGR